MTSEEIRRAFLDYFARREHRVVASSPLVLPNDPTLLFVNAGMNQFKDVFTGRERRDYQRAASSQKCLRVSGKHNDLEMVGRTPRHHTFFEMLGNFSFGDYFKEKAIAYAWELMTDVFELPADRLWVTVFGGSDGLPADAEAMKLWREGVGVPAERILELGESENFWRMGDVGPCGPSSELHYDLGEDLTSVDGASTPETDERRFIEIWNLVFMQFDQLEDGKLEALPAPSIDTGMGLERIAAVLQGKRSNYDSDVFTPLLDAVAARSGKPYGADAEADFSMRVIADHARAFCFLIADGVLPANDSRGYVLRRLLRRAIRHGRKLGFEDPFLQDITPVVTDQLGTVYPELLASREAILEVGRREEQRFAETLTTGLAVLEEALGKLGDSERPQLPGDVLFRLHDTFGFPLELARDIADERRVGLDEAGFEREMEKQRARARASWKGGATAKAATAEAYRELAEGVQTSFVGYDETRLDGVEILALTREGRSVEALAAGQTGDVILEATPFYAEAGGQVGDTGVLVGPDGRAQVTDVQRPLGELRVHRVSVDAGSLKVGQTVVAEVDENRRSAIRRNHTATHLLHAALREVVGTHVKQAGSLVAPDRLRFDFSHFAGLADRALADIESLVNHKVLANTRIETSVMDLDNALRDGAMALFGEKYGDRVRVVSIGEFSRELCGGTHCARTGEIGLIKLTQERGIASGTRRVEAVSGTTSLDRFREEQKILRNLEEQLSVPREQLQPEIDRRLEQLRELQRALEAERVDRTRRRLWERVAAAPVAAGIRVLAERVDGLSAQETRELADGLLQKLGSGVVVLGRADDRKAALLVSVSQDLVGKLQARDLVSELAQTIGGRGGGKADLAEAGGKDPARLDDALRSATSVVEQRMKATT